MRITGMWVLVALALAVALGLAFLSRPISRAVDTPLMRELSRIHQLANKMRLYPDALAAAPGGVTNHPSMDGLVALGVLSADDATYIRDHQIKYYGFDLSRTGSDVPVLEATFSNSSSAWRIVGFSDGHAAMHQLVEKP